MRCRRAVASPHGRVLVVGIWAAGSLVSGGCTPDEMQAPESTLQMPIALAVAPTNGLIGEWKLDETSGTTAVDTKNGYNATVAGGAAFLAGRIGNGLNLNNGSAGTGGKYAETPSNATLDNVQEGDYTISAWFYAYSVPPDLNAESHHWAIVAKAGHHTGLVYQFDQKFSMRHYLTGNILETANSAATQPVNTWHHVAGVVSKTAGTVTLYVNGAVAGSGTFAAGTAAREYGTTRFRIGKAGSQWAADGKVDQVRIYNRALSAAEVADLFNETQGSTFRFPVAMAKGTDESLLGMNYTPDGHMTAASPAGIIQRLEAAREAGARITIRATGGNDNFHNGDSNFVLNTWKTAFNAVKDVDLTEYLADGTLIGHFAIDEPFADFRNMTYQFLEQICQYQKSFAGWRDVPCIVRDLNTRLKAKAPAGYRYSYVDAGWGQLANQAFDAPPYNGDFAHFYQDNLDQGRSVDLGMMYGFNLLNGGSTVPGCAKPASDQCAMSAAEVRKMADAIVSLGPDQGCGVSGYMIDPNPGSARDYFFSSGIQSALQYLWNKTAGAGLQPGVCKIR